MTRVHVCDCTPQMLTAANAINAADLPDHVDGTGPALLSADGRELSDGDTVEVPREAL